MTVKQVAGYLQMDEHTIYKLAHSGQIPSIEIAGQWRFKKDKKFMINELEPWAPHIVYVNGQSVLTPKLGEHQVEIRYIEP